MKPYSEKEEKRKRAEIVFGSIAVAIFLFWLFQQ
jgi:hypothetical protein